MVEYNDGDVLNSYATQTEKQIIELNKVIVALRTKISLLENQNRNLEEEIEALNVIPLPKLVVKQIVEQQAIIQKLQSDLKYYKKHVPVQVIINKENKEKPTRRGGIPK